MSEILEEMQELMCDEDGKPLIPKPPAIQKTRALWRTSLIALNAKSK